MNQNFFLKCTTCETNFRIRMQAGFFYSVPFIYQCPECRVVSEGEVRLPADQAPNIFLSGLKNCEQINDPGNDKYVVQLSTEFYTDKMMKSDGDNHSIQNLSPFMQYVLDNRGINTQDMGSLAEELITNLTNKKENYTAIWDLYSQNSQKYLYKKMKELDLFKSKIKFYNFKELPDYKKIHFLPKKLYGSLLKTDYYKNKVDYVIEPIRKMRKKEYKEFKKLETVVNNSYRKDLEKIVEINKVFFIYFNYILPVIVNESTETYSIDEIKAKKGIIQTDFEYIKKYYAENYENLKDLIVLYILLQNLQIRGSIYKFHPDFYKEFKKPAKNKNIVVDFNREITNVGNRIKILFYDDNTLIDREILEKVFNNDIRNSINHQDYSYNYNEQKVVFLNKKEDIELYLIEFAEILLLGFIVANISWDLYMLLLKYFECKSESG